ncbi:putative CFEM domain-containing protein [Rosellinia necatrix]|uniref:Putative CFEM domain-containing protein n=1 Tax=Rosellinia necatrix TaxID=77044 RepID=A0A1S7UQ54_ROSNE|nr:putative CFEM domain-containing protein [Rosellinia necatrix]
MASPNFEQMLQVALPPCAFSCFAEVVLEPICEGYDQACICTNTLFTAHVNPCIGTSCSVKESLATQNATSALCGVLPHRNYAYEPVVIVFLILALVAFFLRAFARFAMNIKLWWDDLCVLLAMLGTIGVTTSILLAKQWGLGVDIWALPPDNITKILLISSYIVGTLYTISRHLIRVAILIFYLRIFTTSLARWLSLGTLVIVSLDGIAFTLLTIFQCTPISYSWEQWDGEHTGTCINLLQVLWPNVSLGLAYDVWMVLFPIVFVARLQLSLKNQLEVSFMFLIGFVVTGLNLARIPVLRNTLTTTNPTVANVPTLILSALENDFGIICACLPSIHGLVRFLSAGKSPWQKHDIKKPMLATSVATSRGGRTPLISRSNEPGPDANFDSDTNIRLTTTIQQYKGKYDSDPGVHLQDINLVGETHGDARVQAWA